MKILTPPLTKRTVQLLKVTKSQLVKDTYFLKRKIVLMGKMTVTPTQAISALCSNFSSQLKVLAMLATEYSEKLVAESD